MDFNKTVQWREQVGNCVPPSPLASLSDYKGQPGPSTAWVHRREGGKSLMVGSKAWEDWPREPRPWKGNL